MTSENCVCIALKYLITVLTVFLLQEYTFTCALKKRIGKTYIQVKEAGLGQRKVIFRSSDSYDNVKTVLLNEFSVDTAKFDVCLLDAQNNTLNFDTAHCYYQRQKEKYSGATRIYLGISPIWMQKQVSFEEVKEFLLMTHEQKNEPSDANAKIAPDSSVVAYGIDEKVLLFKHQNGKQYQRVHSRWGEFMLIPEEDVEQLQSFNAPDGTVLVIPPVIYFLNNVCKLKDMELKVLIEHELWQLPIFVKTEYENWLCSIDFA